MRTPTILVAALATALLAEPNEHEFVTVTGPVEFMMGSPASERGRTPDEVQRRVRFPRSFAIATKETTVAQFKRFLEARPEIKARHAYPNDPGQMAEVMQRFSPDDNSPQIAVTWYEAAQYCNWLSKEAGLPTSEWVYPVDIRSGMSMPVNYLRRIGFRLPTEAEWEYAARAGTTTARFFGDAEDRLGEYAWFSRNPPRKRDDPVDPGDPTRTRAVGTLKPNPLGLFDVYGNVWEWLHDRRQEFTPSDAIVEDREDAVMTVDDQHARTRRGGSFAYGADVMRSAHRGDTTYFPQQRRDNVGFRVARTVPPAPGQTDAVAVRELEKIEHQLAETYKNGDCAAWGAMLAPEWSVTHITAQVITKAQALEMCAAAKGQIAQAAIDDISVRVFGDAAVVTGRTTFSTSGANPVAMTLRFTDAFIRRSGRWLVVASHATKLGG